MTVHIKSVLTNSEPQYIVDVYDINKDAERHLFKRGELLWQNGFAVYAVMFMKATKLLRSALSAEFQVRSSTSRKAR